MCVAETCSVHFVWSTAFERPLILRVRKIKQTRKLLMMIYICIIINIASFLKLCRSHLLDTYRMNVDSTVLIHLSLFMF